MDKGSEYTEYGSTLLFILALRLGSEWRKFS